MRSFLTLAVTLLLLSLAWIGCKKAPSAGAVGPSVAPGAAASGAAPVGATADASPKGYSGTWALVVGTISLEDDGTGYRRVGEPVALTWREEGDHVLLRAGGEPEQKAVLSSDGNSLVLMPEGGPATALVRVGSEVMKALPKADEIHGPALEAEREKAKQASCQSNLKQLSVALLMYCQDYDERYPPAQVEWEKATYPYCKNQGIYACPSDTGPPSYALNAATRKRGLAEIKQPWQFVALYESDDHKSVAYRHQSGANYGFADGHVKWMHQGREREPSSQLFWDIK